MATTEKASGYVDNESPKQDKGKDASSNGQNQTDSVPSAQLLKAKKIGHRRVDKSTGQITYKKTPSSALSGSIQLGISHTVAGLNVKPERDVLMQDFQVVETYHFPPEGSNVTPAHHFGDFTFRTYAPTAFRYFRDLFGIQPDDYMLSIGQHPLTELSNPGASGSLFYVTHDDKYIIKTVQHKEAEFLQKLLPGYYMNLVQNPRTFLPKFYGLYCVQSSGKNIRVVVMNNLLPRTINMHLKYDLKGSTYKRKASKHERAKKHPTFKDLDLISDFPEGVLLEQDIHTVLIKTIDRDCLVLRSFKIMDYSLLLAIHKIEDPEKERTLKSAEHLPQGSAESFPSSSNDGDGARPSGSDLNQILGGTLLRSKYSNDIHHWSGGIPAKTTHGKNVLLFCGIIDILQCYKFKKKIEHTWKSVIADGDTVSVHRPGFYCERFQKFMSDHVFRKSVVKTQPTKQSRSQISRKIGYSSSSAAKSTSPKVAMRGAGKLSKLPDVLPNEAAESHQTEDDKHSELHAHASASSIGEVDSRMLHTTEMSSHGDEESQTKILGDRDSSADVQSSSEEKSSPSNTDVSGKGDLGAQPSTIDEVNLVLEDEHETNSDEPTTSVSDELRLNSITSFSSVGITVSVGPPSDKEEDTLL